MLQTALILPLGGCLLTGDLPEPALDIPAGYDGASRSPAAAQAALPKLDWWRSFHSPELTQHRRAGARCQSRYRRGDRPHRAGGRTGAHHRRGAVAGDRSCRQRQPCALLAEHRQQRQLLRRLRARHAVGLAQRQLRDRLLGQEPLGAARGGRKRRRQPFRPRGGRALHRGERGQCLFPGAGGAGPPARRAGEPEERERRAQIDPGPVQRRYRLLARRGAAAKPGGDAARRHPAARTDTEAEPHHARHPDGAFARTRACARRQPQRHRHPAGDAGPALAIAGAAPRHPRGGGQARRRQCQCLQRAYPAAAIDQAHRRRRLPERGAEDAAAAGIGLLHPHFRPDATDLRGRQAAGQCRPAEGQAGRIAADLSQGGDLGLRRRGKRARRHPPDRVARAPGARGGAQLASGLRYFPAAFPPGHHRHGHAVADATDFVSGAGHAGTVAARPCAGDRHALSGARGRLAAQTHGTEHAR